MKHHKIRQKIPIYVRVKQALQQNDSDVTADREQYAVNTILNNLLTERGKKRHLCLHCHQWAPVLLHSGLSWGHWSACPGRHSPSPQGWGLHDAHGAPPVHIKH